MLRSGVLLQSKPKKNDASKPIKRIKISKKTQNQTVQKPESPTLPSNGVLKKKKQRYILPTKAISEELIKKCVKNLIKLSEHQKKNNRMFEDETPIFAEIHCIKIQNVKGNAKFLLPNSTVASTGEVCLITPDLKRGKKSDHEPTVDKWEETLRNAGVNNVKTIMPMRQLRVEYDQYELKRRLLTQHDFIMVDTRVLNHVSHLLGKMFFKKHNMLVPVRLDQKDDLKKAIDVGLRTAMLRLNIGETSTIMVGHTGMSKKLICENILSLVQQLNKKFPGGEANIRSIAIKLPLSQSLPIYLTLRPSNTIHPPKLSQKRPKNYRVVEDELTTIPGSKVSVAPDGTVRLIKSNAAESDMEEDPQEESDKDEESGKEDNSE